MGLFKVLCLALVCFVGVPSIAYAQEKDDNKGTQTESGLNLDLISELPPLGDIKLLYPEFPKLSLQCSGCTITPYKARSSYKSSKDALILSKEAAVHLTSWLKMSDTYVRLEVSYAMTRVRNQDLVILQLLQSQMNRQQINFKYRENALIRQRDFALDQAKISWYENPVLWGIAGIVAGAAVTVGIAHAGPWNN